MIKKFSFPGEVTSDEIIAVSKGEDRCKHECKRVEYMTTVNRAALNKPAINLFPTYRGYRFNASETAVIVFYFETFEYQRHVLLKQTFLDFLCKSIISLCG